MDGLAASSQPASSGALHSDSALTADALRGVAPLVRRDKLRPGDVLLSRGRSPHSALIATATRGGYSHAALWVPVSTEHHDVLYLIESDSVGVGPTYPQLMTVEYGHTVESAYSVPGNPSQALVLRHPDMARIEVGAMLEALGSLTEQEFGKSYSRLSRLPFAARDLDPVIRRAASAIAGVADSLQPPTTQYGPFCSELVVRFFERLGLQVMVGPVPPEEISPNALGSQQSLLVVVDDAVINPSDVPDEMRGYPIQVGVKPRAVVPHIVRQRETIAMVDDLTLQLESFHSTNRMQALEVVEQLSTTLHGSLDQAYALQNPRHIRAIGILSGQTDILCLTARRYNLGPESAADGDDDAARLSRVRGLAILMEMTSQLQEQALRSQALLHLAVVRHLCRAGGLTPGMQVRLLERRRAIERWRDFIAARNRMPALEDSESELIRSLASSMLREMRSDLLKSLDATE